MLVILSEIFSTITVGEMIFKYTQQVCFSVSQNLHALNRCVPVQSNCNLAPDLEPCTLLKKMGHRQEGWGLRGEQRTGDLLLRCKGG